MKYDWSRMLDAYLDIETTGLSWFDAYITVIGIFLDDGIDSRLIQLVGKDANKENLLESLKRVHTIFTYNGSRFDLPFIQASLGVNLTDRYYHHDLMYDCWKYNLRGGFKAVETQLCIPRKLKGITGWDAVGLWYKYQNNNDHDSLSLLLQYNGEDVTNLKALKEKLVNPEYRQSVPRRE